MLQSQVRMMLQVVGEWVVAGNNEGEGASLCFLPV